VSADALDARLGHLLLRLLDRRQVRHAVLAVERGDGTIRWEGAAGAADPGERKMRAGTPYFIASVDKLLTATVVLRLHERGDLSVDDPLQAHLPDGFADGLHRLGGVDYTPEITLRHLLGHTSGLPDYLEDRPKGGRALVEHLASGMDRAWGVEDLVRVTRENLTPHFPPQDPASPRAKVRYCDTNYQLLIAVIQEVTGRRLHQVFEDELFRPLGMRQTWFAGLSRPLEPAPEPAALWFADHPLCIPRALRSLWSIYSTAGDTLAFLRALVGGDLFREPATLRLMREPWRRLPVPRDRAALRAPGWPIEYGLGMMRFQLSRALSPLYPVPALIGHSGSTGSWLFYCPERDLFLAGTVDQGSAGPVPFRFLPKVLRAVERAGA
jgi:CubicO group peptidase (beta-lactamase class C family)